MEISCAVAGCFSECGVISILVEAEPDIQKKQVSGLTLYLFRLIRHAPQYRVFS